MRNIDYRLYAQRARAKATGATIHKICNIIHKMQQIAEHTFLNSEEKYQLMHKELQKEIFILTGIKP